ncbi:hypothetical protein [Neobacillus ginsengisoli]|uniref:Nucleoside-diphosphate-sugar epimerase n=1 Tax=Neobacillus ginsengisoli TaxID=904295 RepID=A0ABT9XRJ0_9BACI|nr:hypothetical protein [Neobacillus ginsengisoli]MDQ0198170.1 nucleoside-diphosphate-sugar epimerase [Neobacillus ginsengisoli]
MDKAIIFGVFDFVGFHACKTFLEKGIEVKGIHVENIEKIAFPEEKRLEIGRNANFEEQSFLEWAQAIEQEKPNNMIIFSLYDFFMDYTEAVLKKAAIIRPILQYLERNKSRSEAIVFILPIQMLTRSLNSQALIDIKEFLDQTINVGGNIQLIYVPAIYGPWQPKTFLFQQTILSKISRGEEIKGIREVTIDALFIEDAIETMNEIMESKKPGKYLIESGKKNQWDACAAFLNIDEKLISLHEHGSITVDNELLKVPLRKVTSVSDSLSKQIEHTQRLYDNIIN